MSPSDQELLQLLAGGDRRALGSLYDRYGSRVYHLALLHVQREEVAEEITQDVFLELHRSIEKFRGDAQLFTWLYRITVNKSRDWQREQNAAKRSPWKNILRLDGQAPAVGDIPNFTHPGVDLEQRETSRELFRAIYRLPDRQKTAFLLSIVERLPQRQVAEVMRISEKALESLLQRAKARLRKLLKNHAPGRRK